MFRLDVALLVIDGFMPLRKMELIELGLLDKVSVKFLAKTSTRIMPLENHAPVVHETTFRFCLVQILIHKLSKVSLMWLQLSFMDCWMRSSISLFLMGMNNFGRTSFD
jgi:hypothetical protein